MERFTDRVVVVTGGTRGIGKACAELFAKEGAQVAICGRDAATTAEVATSIGSNVKGYGCNISNSAEVDAFIDAVSTDLGIPYALINNAGITRDGLLMRLKDEQWHEVINTNLDSIFYVCRAAARGMLKQRRGRIINMSSVIGLHGQAGQTNYAAAKAGIIGFSKAYAQEVAARNITVNVVAPGFIETDMTAALGDNAMETIISQIPVKRAGTVEEVAHAVAYLASDEAGYITGTVLSIDGGLGM